MKYTNSWRMFTNLVKDCRKVRLLGLHVGETSVGLARSDVHLKIARPLKYCLIIVVVHSDIILKVVSPCYTIEVLIYGSCVFSISLVTFTCCRVLDRGVSESELE